VEALAARLAARLSHRRHAGGRRRSADLPVLLDGEAPLEAPEEFGTVGAIEGVAGPEAANNASAAGVLVPMLALGLPTSATAAIMLSAFQSYGINPGPQLLDTQPALVWSLIASLYIGNVMLLVLNLPLVGLWVKILKVPEPLLYAGILVFATIGTYGISRSVVDLLLLYAMGALGYLMRRFDFPTAPVIIGMILGPLAEQEFRRAMTISQGDLTIFLTRPLSAGAAGDRRHRGACAARRQANAQACGRVSEVSMIARIRAIG
jgi:putative tricarboxylic transport membrane protein